MQALSFKIILINYICINKESQNNMYYTTSRCGHCKIIFQSMDTSDWPVGASVIKCSHCGGMNNTGKTLWRDMSSIRKFGISIKLLFSTLVFVISPFAGGIALLLYAENWWKILSVLAFLFSYTQGKNLFYINKFHKIIEKRFDENGGFLYSNEQYSD